MLCCLSTLSIQRSKHPMHWIVYAMLFVDTVDTKIKACNAFNAICRSSWYKTHSHISGNDFLNIQRFSIRKKFWKAETEGFSTIPSNTIYVDPVNTRQGSLMHSMLCMSTDTVNTKHLYTFLPITFLIFNRFSIRKKFWKAETVGFSTISSNTIYVDTVDTRHKYF